MIPDYLIIDEIKRRREEAWEPEPLRLPLYAPVYPKPEEEERRDEGQRDEESPGVIIIQM